VKRRSQRKRLPSYDELLDAAAEVAEAAAAGRESVALAGGLAMQVWGSPRLTADLDVVAQTGLGYSGESLSFGGVRSLIGHVPVDVIVRADEYRSLYEAALRDAVSVDDVPAILVIEPEYLVAMKMVAGRPKDESDVRYLVLLDDFDGSRAEAIVREYLGPYAVREYRSLVAEAKWRRERGQE
jgi:hypothetical protein